MEISRDAGSIPAASIRLAVARSWQADQSRFGAKGNSIGRLSSESNALSDRRESKGGSAASLNFEKRHG